MERPHLEHPLLFFDGYCNLCNYSVDFLIKRDKRRVLRYSSLQGIYASRYIPEHASQEDSIVLLKDGKIHTRSSAALIAYASLGGLRKWVLAFWIVPKFLRDAIYNFVAKNRYKWYGKRDTCRVPTKEERKLFID